MGGRGSGGGRGGGGGGASNIAPISQKAEQEYNTLMNQSYKYDDDAYEFNSIAKGELAMSLEYRRKGKLEQAKKYKKYSDETFKKAKTAEKQAKELKDQASKIIPKEAASIPRTYQYQGETGVRSVYKSLQTAKEHWKQRKADTVSTARADSPTIVQSPKGGYSVMPHKIAKINKLKEISPYRISDTD